MKELFRPFKEERTWTVRAPKNKVRQSLDGWLAEHRAKVVSADSDKVVVSMGSRFLTRMIGGMLSPERWLPVAVLVALEEEGKSTRVLVRVADNLGVIVRRGRWPRMITKKFEEIFASLEQGLGPKASS